MIEVVIAVAITAIVLTAIVTGVVAAVHRFTPLPVQSALDAAVAREMRVAVDLLKYSGGSIAPRSIPTSIPMPGSSPVPVQMSVSTVTGSSGAVTVTIGAVSQTNPPLASTLTATIAQPAPLPSSNVSAGTGSAPQ
jgi:hypothetical protein